MSSPFSLSPSHSLSPSPNWRKRKINNIIVIANKFQPRFLIACKRHSIYHPSFFLLPGLMLPSCVRPAGRGHRYLTACVPSSDGFSLLFIKPVIAIVIESNRNTSPQRDHLCFLLEKNSFDQNNRVSHQPSTTVKRLTHSLETASSNSRPAYHSYDYLKESGVRERDHRPWWWWWRATMATMGNGSTEVVVVARSA